jgi:hypothetical protein
MIGASHAEANNRVERVMQWCPRFAFSLRPLLSFTSLGDICFHRLGGTANAPQQFRRKVTMSPQPGGTARAGTIVLGLTIVLLAACTTSQEGGVITGTGPATQTVPIRTGSTGSTKRHDRLTLLTGVGTHGVTAPHRPRIRPIPRWPSRRALSASRERHHLVPLLLGMDPRGTNVRATLPPRLRFP